MSLHCNRHSYIATLPRAVNAMLWEHTRNYFLVREMGCFMNNISEDHRQHFKNMGRVSNILYIYGNIACIFLSKEEGLENLE